MKPVVLIFAVTLSASADIVDRVAVNIGRQVITDFQVTQELRLQAFIQGEPLTLDKESKRKAADRLVDQILVRRELEFARFASVADSEVDPAFKEIRDRFPTEAAFQADLVKSELTADDLRHYLSWTLTFLRFIEYRFQPSIQITTAQIRQEYRRQTADWAQKHNGADPPSQEQLQPEIEKIVRQRLVDASLDRWLGEVRTQNEIIYHGEYKL